MNKGFGPHLHGDIKLKAPWAMGKTWAHDVLLDLCNLLEMTPMGGVHADYYDGDQEDFSGVSATLHVQTSNITLHTFDFGYLFVDVFTCKTIPGMADIVRQFFFEEFRDDIESQSWSTIIRGYSNYPEDRRYKG
jgi:S-adenosylmethionine/arginine decarboxylase-like enzyme